MANRSVTSQVESVQSSIRCSSPCKRNEAWECTASIRPYTDDQHFFGSKNQCSRRYLSAETSMRRQQPSKYDRNICSCDAYACNRFTDSRSLTYYLFISVSQLQKGFWWRNTVLAIELILLRILFDRNNKIKNKISVPPECLLRRYRYFIFHN